MPQSAELQKATCTCMLWARVPWVLTSQPARLSDRLPALDMSKNIYYSFFFFFTWFELLLKKIALVGLAI